MLILLLAIPILLVCAVVAMPAVALWHPRLPFSLRYLIATVPVTLNYVACMLPIWMESLGLCAVRDYINVCTVYGIDITWSALLSYLFLATLFLIAIPLSLWLGLGTLLDQILRTNSR